MLHNMDEEKGEDYELHCRVRDDVHTAHGKGRKDDEEYEDWDGKHMLSTDDKLCAVWRKTACITYGRTVLCH